MLSVINEEKKNKKKIVENDEVVIYESNSFYFINDGRNECVIPKESLSGKAITLLLLHLTKK